jgi:hypothetical protein
MVGRDDSSMIARIEPLPWDTEFFGRSIGRVVLDSLRSEDLVEIETEALDTGIECAYGSLDPSDAEATVLVQRHGYRFVEAATTFNLRLEEPPIPRPEADSEAALTPSTA